MYIPGNDFTGFILIASIVLSYFYRNTKIGAAIWGWWKLFFLILIITLGANYGKDKIKEWWKKQCRMITIY